MIQTSKHREPAFVSQRSIWRLAGLPLHLMLIAVAVIALLAAGTGLALGDTWTDTTGQFKVEAQFLGLKANMLYLKKENGVVIKVPLDRLSAESQQQARQMAAPAPAAADTPDGAIRTVMTGVEQGNLRVVWDALPPSYQSDVNDVVHTFAENMDAQVWTAGTGIGKKAVRILREKKQFIFAHPILRAILQQVDENWDPVVDVLDTIVNSELTDLEKLKTIDVGTFLTGTGKAIVDKMMAVASAMEDEDFTMPDFPGVEVDAAGLAALRSAKVSLVSTDGDTATVSIEKKDGEVEDHQMVRVEGRWLPKKMVDGWAAEIAKAKTALSTEMGEQLKQNKQQLLEKMSELEENLDRILAADTQQAFNQAITALLKPPGGAGPNPFGGGGAKPFGGGADEAVPDPFGG